MAELQPRETKPRQGDASIPVERLFRLDGRTIVLTGGAGALGVAIAQAVLESGGDVVVLDYLEKPATQIWEPLEAVATRVGGQISYRSCDVTNEDRVTEVFKSFVPNLRYPIRGLMACAGVSDNGPAHEFPVKNFRRLLDINVTGTFLVAQAVSREMRRANVDGSMVLVASMSGTVVNKGVDTAGYNSSKAAVLQLARSLAAEWGSRVGMPLIRVNTLSPGYIRTAATAEALKKPGMESQWTGDNMLNRLSYVDEFRAPALFLLGDGSSFMTAADLRVDGGHCAW